MQPLCPYQEECSGCQLLHIDYAGQKNLKIQELKSLLKTNEIETPEIEFLSAGVSALRDRLDFSYQNGALGLYHKERREIVDLSLCAQLSPRLQAALSRFRKIQWPVEKASFRLRVNAKNEIGVWIDMANIDIKKILDEKNILQGLQTWAFVEMGQRRKTPIWNGEEFKLSEPQLRPWFQTFMDDQPLDLFCHVASFTQPSLEANKLIAKTIATWVGRSPQARVLEFGSGIGNLTFAALATATQVTACEIDELSLQGLNHTAEHLPGAFKNKKQNLTVFRGDFQKKLTQNFADFDVVLANPPRSGLMNFLSPLESLPAETRPPGFIYMSCFPESLMQDLVRLKKCGYKIQEIKILDQFPQTNHYEVLVLLQREKANA